MDANEKTAPFAAKPTLNGFLAELKKVYRPDEILSEKEGGNSQVFVNRKNGKKIVLRILNKPLEIYTKLCSVSHENLPAVYDVISCSDGQAVLEEYVKGICCSDVLSTGLYTYSGAVSLIKSVCSALEVLHGWGFVHRDIKPENVMITDDGKVKLIDFDASRRFDSRKSGDTVALGTVGFAPPEQFGITQSDPRSDIYALGVLLNVLLTGVHPSERLAGGKAGRIVLRCTQINPEKRYQTVKQFERAL